VKEAKRAKLRGKMGSMKPVVSVMAKSREQKKSKRTKSRKITGPEGKARCIMVVSTRGRRISKKGAALTPLNPCGNRAPISRFKNGGK